VARWAVCLGGRELDGYEWNLAQTSYFITIGPVPLSVPHYRTGPAFCPRSRFLSPPVALSEESRSYRLLVRRIETRRRVGGPKSMT
jgi:hypothetical protein